MATSVDITVEFDKGASNEQFTVTATVTSTTGPIPPEIFVFETSSKEFSRVAHVGDLDYPTNRNDLSIAYYRQDEVTLHQPSIEEIREAIDQMERRIQSLVDDFYAEYDSFEGVDTTTYTPN